MPKLNMEPKLNMDTYIDGSMCMDEQALDIEKMHSSEILRYRHKKN